MICFLVCQRAGEFIPCPLLRLFQFLYLPVDPHNGGLVFLELLCPAFNLVIDALQDHVIALFDWFITLTLDPKQVDITDYNECAKLLSWQLNNHEKGLPGIGKSSRISV